MLPDSQSPGTKMSANLFIFSDKYHTQLLSCAQVDVFFLETYRVKIAQNCNQEFKINFKPKKNAKLRIYT